MAQAAVTPSSLVVCTGSCGSRLCCVWVAVCSLPSGWNAAVPDMCDAEVSALALEAVRGLSSTYGLLGHTSRVKPGQGIVWGSTGFWS